MNSDKRKGPDCGEPGRVGTPYVQGIAPVAVADGHPDICLMLDCTAGAGIGSARLPQKPSVCG